MPDIPASILDSTNSFDSIFALQLDTKSRFDDIRAGIQKPIRYDFGERPSQTDLLNPKKMAGSLGEALFSKDRRIADDAVNSIRSNQSGLLTSRGVGVPERIPYDKSMDKYLKGDFGYNPYIPLEENEAFNYRWDYMNQSFPERVLKNIGVGLTRFVAGVGLKMGQTLGYMGSMIGNGIQEIFDPKGNNFMADVADNSLSRYLMGVEEDMKNSNLLSVFKPRNWEDKGFFQKLGNGAFWTDEVADGAAFMGEMVASMYAFGLLGKIGGIGKLGAVPINMASKLGDAGKALDFVTKFATGAKDVAGIGRWAFATTSESAMEAAQKYQTEMEDLQRKRDIGLNSLSDTEMRSRAGDIAASSFRSNMMVLSLSNAFENRFIFEPLLGRARKNTLLRKKSQLIEGGKTERGVDLEQSDISPITKNIEIETNPTNVENFLRATEKKPTYSNWLGRKTDWKNPNSRLRFWGSTAGSATLVEGFWEENAQLAIERLAGTDSYGSLAFWNKVGEQAKSFFTGDDPQASTNIGLGALIGIVGTGGAAKIFGDPERLFSGERRAKARQTSDVVNTYEEYRKKFLNFQDIWKKDATGKLLKNEDGSLQINEDRAEAIMHGINKMLEKQDASTRMMDPYARKHMQEDALSYFVYAAKASGLYNRVMNRINSAENMDADTLQQLGFDPNSTVDIVSLKESLQEIGDIYEEEKSASKIQGSDTDANSEANRRANIYGARVRQRSAAKLAEEYMQASLEDNKPSIYTKEAVAETSDIHEYNSLTYQEQGLEQFQEMASDVSGFYDPHIAAEKKRIAARKAEIKKALEDKISQVVNNEVVAEKDLIILPGGFLMATKKFKDTTDSEQTQGMFTREKTDVPKHLNLLGTAQILFDIEKSNLAKHAQMQNTVSQQQYLIDQLRHPLQGMANFDNFKKWTDSIKDNDIAQDAKEEEEEVKAADVSAEKKELGILGFLTGLQNSAGIDAWGGATEYVKDVLKLPETATLKEIQEAAQAKKNSLATPAPVAAQTAPVVPVVPEEVKEPEPPPVVLEEEKKEVDPVLEDTVLDIVLNEVDKSKPASWKYPSKSSTDDAVDLAPDQEQLKDDDYSRMRSDFIKTFMANPDFDKKYKLFMIKDSFPEIYKNTKAKDGTPIVQEINGKWDFIIEPGEVIAVQNLDGTYVTVGSMLGFKEKYPDIVDLPIVFSFNESAFFNKNTYPTKLGIKMDKYKISEEEAKAENDELKAESNEARRKIKEGETDAIEVKMMHFTTGINPKTLGIPPAPVQDRFGDFSFEIVRPNSKGEKTSTQYGGKYPVGTVVAKVQGQDFPVVTSKLSSYDVFEKVKEAMRYDFDTREDAEVIRAQFLEVMVNTNDYQFFTVDKKGDKFRVNFRRATETDIAAKSDKKTTRQNADLSNNLIGDAKLNVSYLGLKEGYTDFDPQLGANSPLVEKETYEAFIKPKLVTTLKKVVDKDGKLYMDTVNPYFSFVIANTADKITKKTQGEYYEKLKRRIETLALSQTVDIPKIIETLGTELKLGKIDQQQYDKLSNMIQEIKPADIGPEAALKELGRKLANKEITQAQYLFASAIAKRTIEAQKNVPSPAKEAPKKELGQVDKVALLKRGDLVELQFTDSRGQDSIVVSVITVRKLASKTDTLWYKVTMRNRNNNNKIHSYVVDSSGSALDGSLKIVSVTPDLVSDVTDEDVVNQILQEEVQIDQVPEQPVEDDLANLYTKEVDINKILAGEAKLAPEYKVEGRYLYIPEKNVIVHLSGRRVNSKDVGELLDLFIKKYGYDESPGHNTGFAKVIVGPYTIFRGPTRSGQVIVLDETGKSIKVELDAIKKALKDTNDKNKLQDFITKYC